MAKNNPRKDPRCPHCKGQFASGGTYRQRFPLGFGFHDGSGKFVIDVIETRGYTGFCMDCGKDGKVEFSRIKKTITPAGINRKIAAFQ